MSESWAAFGDSSVFSAGGLGLENYFPAVLQGLMLSALGRIVTIDNQGHSGDGTGLVLSRVNGYTPGANPTTAIVYCGSNDNVDSQIGTVQASPSPTTLAFGVDAGKTSVLTPTSAVLVGTTNQSIKIASVNTGTDVITLSQPLRIAPSAGDLVTLDTITNLATIGSQLRSLGFSKLYFGVTHYKNWSVSGDNFWSTYSGTDGTVTRPAQRAGARIIGGTALDFWWYMRKRIIDGIDVQGSASWHMADLDGHLNIYGQSILASICFAYIQGIDYAL